MNLRAFPQFVDKWGLKATLVRKMVRRRRRFLTRVFEREKRMMLLYYQGKKKFKKLLTKLQSIKQHNLEKIIDDYFYGVCYQYYKRQIQIYIVLKYKYLRDQVTVQIEDKRFEYQGSSLLNMPENNAFSEPPISPQATTSLSGQAETLVSDGRQEGQEGQEAAVK